MISKILSLCFILYTSTAFAAITMDEEVFHKDFDSWDEILGKRTPFSKKLTVHLVPHSHDDVGWLKTVDEYFTGMNNSIQMVNVRLILDEVTDALAQDPNKRFSYVEMKFFTMWWERITEEKKDQVKKLVKNGQLELINAGWSMHDEACPHYEDMINNMMIGHDFVKREFGVTPRIGWQIDPFGHSNTNARLFAEMGFDAWFFARLDIEDKLKRVHNDEMEFIWRASFEELGEDSQIFTHALFQHYKAPRGFDFDAIGRSNSPVDIDESLSTFNANKKALEFHEQLMLRLKHYKSQRNLFVLMGDDFRYQNAHMSFQSIDNLIQYYNKHLGKLFNVELIYSTPSQYVDAIAAENLEWPTKYDDMLPYSDSPLSYWSGYFSSRANSKAYIRRASLNFHASSKLYSLAAVDQSTSDEFMQEILDAKQSMLDILGVVQHHDAVTGTAKQHVADDYAQNIYKSMEANNKVYAEFIGSKAEKLNIDAKNWTWCFRTNSTYEDCPINDYTETDGSVIVAIHNPSLHQLSQIEMEVPKRSFYNVDVLDLQDKQFRRVDSSILCNRQWLETNDTQSIKACTLVANAEVFPSTVGIFRVTFGGDFDKELSDDQSFAYQDSADGQTLTNGYMRLKYIGRDEQKGAEFQIQDLVVGTERNFYIDLRYWSSSQGLLAPSGAYIFRPKEDQYDSYKYSKLQSVQFVDGSIKQEFVMYFGQDNGEEKAIIKVSIENRMNVVKTDVILYGLPNDPEEGHEVTANFQAKDFDNGGVFWTDSNGLAMQKRVLNHRPTWKLRTVKNLNITANYYPIQTCISMQSHDGWQMNVMNSRAQGGSVLQNGRIELMQNRRMNKDDMRGVQEALNETDSNGNGIVVPATYYIQIFQRDQTRSVQRLFQHKQDYPPQYFFAFNYSLSNSNDLSVESTVLESTSNQNYEGLKYNMIPLQKNKIMLRIENLSDTYDTGSLQSFDFDVTQLAQTLYFVANGEYESLQFINIQEMSLTGNQPIQELHRNKIHWKTVDDANTNDTNTHQKLGFTNSYEVNLQNQRIRVFNIEFIVKDFDNYFLN